MKDDIYLKLIKYDNIFVFYKSFFIISSVFCIILTIVIKNILTEEDYFLNSFLENWEKKPIIDLKLISNTENNIFFRNQKIFQENKNSSCPENYENYNLGEFPTNETLCDCSHSIFFDFSQGVLKPYKCSFFLNLIGCMDYKKFNYFAFNSWKNHDICIKRHKYSYLDLNFYRNPRNNNMPIDNNRCCNVQDTNNIYICNKICPITNEDVSKIINKKFPTNENDDYNDYEDNQIRKKNNFFRKKFLSQNIKINLTTYSDLENFYMKNFNKNANNKIFKNKAISEIIISDSFPCLIPQSYKKPNILSNLFHYFLNNFENIKLLSQKNIFFNKHKNFTENKKPEILNFKNFDDDYCIFYQNSFYDKRYYILDKIKYLDYLDYTLLPNETFYNTRKKEILNRKIQIESNINSQNFYVKDYDYMYLITKPFFGWNKNFCSENPKEKINNLIKLIKTSVLNIDLIIFLKVFCFIYILFIILMQKLKLNFEYGLYLGKSDFEMWFFFFFDILYNFLNSLNLINIIYLFFKIKNLNNLYLKLIRNNCLDQHSSRILGYLSDSCEETLIYCLLVMSIISIDIIIFFIITVISYYFKNLFWKNEEK